MTDLMEDINNINAVKKDLSELPLDPTEKSYLENSVTPVADLLYKLSTTALNLSQSSDYLSKNFIKKPKKRKIKENIDTIYDINEICSELFKIIKKRIDFLK